MTDTARGVIHQLAVSTLLVIGMAGCTSLHTFHDTAILWHATNKAYRNERNVPATGKCSRHYTNGWKQGYFEVADGGSPAPPAIAPRKYWGLKWNKPEGRKCVDAWFRGRADGAAAAVDDGWFDFSYVPVESVETGDPFDVTPATVVPLEAVTTESCTLSEPADELSGVVQPAE